MSLFVGNVVLFIVSLSLVGCSAGCGVNSIVCVFEWFRIILFCLVKLNMSCRYGCTCCLTVFMWVKRIVTSSAYVTKFILLFGGIGMSNVHIFKCW